MLKAKKIILIIDDNEMSRKLVDKTLTHVGYQTVLAKNVNEALATISQTAPHLILLDLMLPDVSGFELLAQLQKHKAHAPIIVMSGLNDTASVYEAISLGASDYLTKPLSSALLLRKVLKAMKDRTSLSFSFGKPGSPLADSTAKLTLAGKITMANEVGILFEGPVKMAEEENVKIESSLLDELACQNAHFRRTTRTAKATDSGVYLNEIAVVGLNADAIERIRKITRGWR